MSMTESLPSWPMGTPDIQTPNYPTDRAGGRKRVWARVHRHAARPDSGSPSPLPFPRSSSQPQASFSGPGQPALQNGQVNAQVSAVPLLGTVQQN